MNDTAEPAEPVNLVDPRDLPQCHFVDNDTVRLISTAYITEPALAPLADTAEELALLEDLEGLTSARRGPAHLRPDGIAAEELLNESYGYGWTYINAAFCYTRAEGNRFNGAERGAWYAAFGAEAVATAQDEVAWHLSRELAACGCFDNVTDYRELRAGFMAEFSDLRSHTGLAALMPDPQVAYPAGQALARRLLQDGGNGVLYASLRHTGGYCLAAFRPHLVQNLRQGDTWRFHWRGQSQPEITKFTHISV